MCAIRPNVLPLRRVTASGITMPQPSEMSPRRRCSHVVAAERQTVETPKAPGSESNFTGLPKNRDEIAVTTPIDSRQMEVRGHQT